MYCSQCGAQNPDSALSCTSCGKPLAQPSAAAAAKTSGMAIASLVLGILGFLCGLSAIPGLILGIVALSRINRSGGRLTGKGLAIGGTVTSAVALLILPVVAILAAMLMPALSRARLEARKVGGMNQLKQVGMAIAMYSIDYGEQYPPSLADLGPYLGEERSLVHPADGRPKQISKEGLQCSYEYVGPLSGDVPPSVIICYSRKGIYPDGRDVLHADGSVWFASEEQLHDPVGPPDTSLRASFDELIRAPGQAMRAEQATQVREFYEIED